MKLAYAMEGYFIISHMVWSLLSENGLSVCDHVGVEFSFPFFCCHGVTVMYLSNQPTQPVLLT